MLFSEFCLPENILKEDISSIADISENQLLIFMRIMNHHYYEILMCNEQNIPSYIQLNYIQKYLQIISNFFLEFTFEDQKKTVADLLFFWCSTFLLYSVF